MGEMKLIPGFDLDFIMRTVWVTKEAKEAWAKVIPQISTLICNLEVESVVQGHRSVTWQTLDETYYMEHQAEAWENMGLASIPIKKVGQFAGFAHKHAPLVKDQPCNVCVIVAKSYDLCKEFRKAFVADDNFTQGALLGYPKCCSQFFCDMWPKGYFDPIWQAAENTPEENIVRRGENFLRIRANPLSNAALRYLGLRACFHIPCSFNCQPSIEIAEQRLALGEKSNPDLIKRLKTLMRMPHSWDSYHGIAVVRSPIFYAITASVPTAERYVVEVEGDFIPKESRKGVIFPFTEVKE